MCFKIIYITNEHKLRVAKGGFSMKIQPALVTAIPCVGIGDITCAKENAAHASSIIINMVNLLKLSINLPQKTRILIIRRDNIGDLACTTPAIAALRQHYPEAEIAALVNSYNAEVLQGNPNLDHVFVYQKLKHAGGIASRIKAIYQRLKLIAQLRRWKPDVTILAKSSYERHGLNFARQIGAKNIIGFVPDDLNQAKGLPDVQLKTLEFTAVHEVEAVNQLLAPLDIQDALGPLQVFLDSSIVAALSACLPVATKRIALHISARESERRWGNDNFIVLVKHIIQTQLDTQILLFWSPGKADDPHHPGDDEAAQALMNALPGDRLIPMPTQNLTELIAALSLCDVFIGTDGGAMHLAVALNKKILALFENLPGKLNHWYPWHVTNQVVCSSSKVKPDISQITTEQVFRALDALLRSNG